MEMNTEATVTVNYDDKTPKVRGKLEKCLNYFDREKGRPPCLFTLMVGWLEFHTNYKILLSYIEETKLIYTKNDAALPIQHHHSKK